VLKAVTALLVAGFVFAPAPAASTCPPEGKINYLLSRFCVLCHGAQLAGDEGPSLQPDALRGKSNPKLISAILYGHGNPRMPDWSGCFTYSEASQLVGKLRAGVTFPDD